MTWKSKMGFCNAIDKLCGCKKDDIKECKGE